MLILVILLVCYLVSPYWKKKVKKRQIFLIKTDFIYRGSEDLKLKNQKRVERLIEEIHAMKVIP